jgi:hypothetical protein
MLSEMQTRKLRGRAISQSLTKNVSKGFLIWGGKRESNPQPSEPQSGALPVELFPPPGSIIATSMIATAVCRCQNQWLDSCRAF